MDLIGLYIQLLKVYYLKILIFLNVCVCVCAKPGIYRIYFSDPSGSLKVETPGLELLVVVSYLLWVLGPKLWVLCKSTCCFCSILNHLSSPSSVNFVVYHLSIQ